MTFLFSVFMQRAKLQHDFKHFQIWFEFEKYILDV